MRFCMRLASALHCRKFASVCTLHRPVCQLSMVSFLHHHRELTLPQLLHRCFMSARRHRLQARTVHHQGSEHAIV